MWQRTSLAANLGLPCQDLWLVVARGSSVSLVRGGSAMGEAASAMVFGRLGDAQIDVGAKGSRQHPTARVSPGVGIPEGLGPVHVPL